MSATRKLFVTPAFLRDRGAAPVQTIPGFSLDEQVASTMHPHPALSYEIEQRIGDGPWERKCRYGADEELAVSRVVWWNRLLRGRRSYRVICVSGASRSVYFSEGRHV